MNSSVDKDKNIYRWYFNQLIFSSSKVQKKVFSEIDRGLLDSRVTYF